MGKEKAPELEHKKDINDDGQKTSMRKKYRTYNSASQNRKSDEITIYDYSSGKWKNIKSPFSKIRRRLPW